MANPQTANKASKKLQTSHVSAMKRARQSLKRHVRNKTLLEATKTIVKKATSEIRQAKDTPAAATGTAGASTANAGTAAAGTALKSILVAERALQKAASKGIIPKKRASRKISRLHALLN